jgi:hypothetical protein
MDMSRPHTQCKLEPIKDEAADRFLIKAEFSGISALGEFSRVEFQWDLVFAEALANNIKLLLATLKK